ncbi:Long-chain-fatty-acid-CoA ligase FadD15 [Auxenochlorella protothecoides]|uniref:Long-chain-fatty-acid-CoA ligase FadD15 n=1 Tax=Auxenochlorella protothecoides TaxID=3075 RepID=A0A087SBU3_AUXPR|nr:Long-chain-fatty-acid-CoA ligase FadD15 [Auxenochlorella protothecoides]KFM23197.1 Long-chain-fatty-acid-CoA ligase FadD15 [Auxenochlorella protothecoides]
MSDMAALGEEGALCVVQRLSESDFSRVHSIGGFVSGIIRRVRQDGPDRGNGQIDILPRSVRRRVEDLIAQDKIGKHEVDARMVRALADLPERLGEEACTRFDQSVDSGVRSRQGFMMGIIKRLVEEDRFGRPPPAGYRRSGWRKVAEVQYSPAPQPLERTTSSRKPSLRVTEAASLPDLEFSETIDRFAAGLQSLGLEKGERVALFSEGSSRWMVADQGIMSAGGVDAVRGTANPVEELEQIVLSSQASGLVIQDASSLAALLPRLCEGVPQRQLKFVVQLWGDVAEEARAALPCSVLSYAELLARGAETSLQRVDLTEDDLATLVYTSGTTGNPRGVMLTHGNLLYQLRSFPTLLELKAGESTLNLLPPYYIASCGCRQVFTSVRHFRDDLQRHPPTYFVCVPLVLETLYSRVKHMLTRASLVRRTLATSLLAAALAYTRARRVVNEESLAYVCTGTPLLAFARAWLVTMLLAPLNWLAQKLVVSKVRAGLGVSRGIVSGGGSLAAHLDDFYEAIGIPVLNGWGLTETSPVLACRSMTTGPNIRGSVGRPLPGTRVRVVDPGSREEVPDGTQGLLLASGPGLMSGYWNDALGTAAVLLESQGQRWFDSGDLGWKVPEAGGAAAGALVLSGRAKDTIVLSNGENVQPQSLEDAICTSPYITFAVLVGDGHRALGALLVPNRETLGEVPGAIDDSGALDVKLVTSLLKAEVTKACVGRAPWEKVHAVHVLQDPFSMDDGTLTRTMKPCRPKIRIKYASEVKSLEAALR